MCVVLCGTKMVDFNHLGCLSIIVSLRFIVEKAPLNLWTIEAFLLHLMVLEENIVRNQLNFMNLLGG